MCRMGQSSNRSRRRCYWCTPVAFVILFWLHLTTTASCLATPSPSTSPTGKQTTQGKLVIVSTQKNGGHLKIFPPAQNSSTNRQSFQIRGMIQNVQSALRSTFMPSGYPHKTPPGYLTYSIWSWIQDLSTQLRSVLATQRILEGVGVGREGATALSALMNFLARDASGMAATLFFTSLASSKFRCDIKRWRLVADLAVDVGITLEVAAVAFPSLFLPMICIGNMCKAVCGVAAGACSGAINLHWAKNGSDISDISAKFGAQHTVTGGFGLIFAALFARTVATWKLWKLWILYSALTLLHIVANMQCMRLIAFQSLNHIRMNIVLSEFLDWMDQQQEASTNLSLTLATISTPPPNLSSPSQVTKIEPLFFFPNWLMARQAALPKSLVPIFFGGSFNDFYERSIMASDGTEIVDESLDLGNDGYLISAGMLSSLSKKRLCVDVVFRSNATPVDEAKAYLHATLLARQLKQLEKEKLSPSDEKLRVAEIEVTVKGGMNIAWNIFQRSCEVAGWDLSRTEIQSLGYEVATAVQ